MNRVELCFHSKFDCKGSVLGTEDMMECAGEMGAIGITDFASILGWPQFKREKDNRAKDAKLILGCELPVIFKNGIHCVTCLVRNETGRNNLYQLITEGERTFKKGKMMRVTDEQLFCSDYREGILIGGDEELICAISEEASDDILEILAEDYDFLLVDVSDKEHIDGYKKIISLGVKLGKPVVATCKPHYFMKEDKVAYDILNWNQNHEWNNKDRHLYTTEEMLEKLHFVSKEKAVELVVKNSNIVADMCKEIRLFDSEKLYPILEHQDERLKELCYKKAAYFYQVSVNALPKNVQKRIDWELRVIANTDMSFIFLQLNALLDRMNLKPYQISIRGVWGNSFVAYLCGLLDYNPMDYHLSPCLAYGIHGDKEIDINLNFPGNRQKEALRYLGESEGNQFSINAGVYGVYLKGRICDCICRYEEAYGMKISHEEQKILLEKLSNVYRTRGVYPGGTLLVPQNVDVSHYFPMAYIDKETCTSYFHYQDLESLFYKQDILGHQILELLNKMSEKTEVELNHISFEDEKVMKLFICDEKEGSFGCEGLYEFSSKKSLNLLRGAKPLCFDDLIKVMAFMHGSGVWSSNMEALLSDGTISLKEAIASRDDMFDYLIKAGVDEGASYEITEYVRKGNVANQTSEFWEYAKEQMKENNVADWFIPFCEKIHYMIPRASAISYAQTVWREGFFKVYYPLIYEDYHC